ncbi:MAG: AAA family ATPase [Pelodictyon phaeoclathratiforme]
MYIDQIEIKNFRTFRNSKITFCHADQDASKMPKPKLPNMNLLLANNGNGKTSLLKAIALAALGPAVGKSGIYPYQLIRRESNQKKPKHAVLKASFKAHEQDCASVSQIESFVEVIPEGDMEILEWSHRDQKLWHPVFNFDSDAFFMVGYGATRRVSKSNRMEQSGKYSPRAARVMGLFDDDYSLRPLNTWLPRYYESKQLIDRYEKLEDGHSSYENLVPLPFQQDLKERYEQVVNLLNRLVGKNDWEFTGKQDKDGEYLYGKKGIEVPFPALSDGYRAFFGWLGDLLFHVCETCPSGKKLKENKGIVMVDEIDLHLHPKWQMTVLQTLAKEFPKIQFIVTSHSPLIVGSLEWMNIIVMKPGTKQSSTMERIEWGVHGLDADQILLTEFFGLDSTRAPGKKRTLKELTLKARGGDTEAAKQLLEQMSRGVEMGK